MRFNKTFIEGVCTIDISPFGDERGFFARLFCSGMFGEHGLAPSFVQANNSLSRTKGTLRGMHYQLYPKQEDKLVRCIKGSLYDVVLDLRENSETYGKWFAETLTQDNRRMMYVPKGCAHGFYTLEDDTEILYFVSEVYSGEHERGVRYDDPAFSIEWPGKPSVVSKRDQNHPDYELAGK